MNDKYHCWLCNSNALSLYRRSTLPSVLTAGDFAISGSQYGRTGEMVRCDDCGFLFCPQLSEVLQYYQSLEDPDYEANHSQHVDQARRLLQRLKAQLETTSGKRLLDVGAGSGALLEAASQLGFDGEGIEPSKWLADKARSKGLNVHHGVLPHPEISRQYGLATVIDVIEHVPDPVGLLREVASLVLPTGAVLIVTPDVRSLAARMLGRRWWHFRPAHIGYFNKDTLKFTCAQAGLLPIALWHPAWIFKLSYLAERLQQYTYRYQIPRWTDGITLPLNLYDSVAILARPDA